MNKKSILEKASPSESSIKKLAAYILILISILTVSAQNDSGVIVFQHANVIDGVSSEPLRDVTVIIANGKITGIQKNLKHIPAGAEVIDLKGKWLLPGYIDSHVHIGDFESAQRALRFGITTARNLALPGSAKPSCSGTGVEG